MVHNAVTGQFDRVHVVGFDVQAKLSEGQARMFDECVEERRIQPESCAALPTVINAEFDGVAPCVLRPSAGFQLRYDGSVELSIENLKMLVDKSEI